MTMSTQGRESSFILVFIPIIKVVGFFLNWSMGPTVIQQEQNSLEESNQESTTATILNFI